MQEHTPLPLPLATAPAGFPSPAEDYLDQRLDLNEHLVRNPAATYFIRVQGDSMRGAGIASGDLLVVDRSVEPRPGHVVVAAVHGELTVKRLKRLGRLLVLAPENPDFTPIPLNEENAVEIWGVATHVIHRLAAAGGGGPCSSR
ncbi:LexA family protein [Fundidesulfovibrio soli]|uniref:LexA family protein n=1 Tax=Fundidesulfovibrio soli TaxID=2922716 RepID=UPI001FAE90E2|nr:translesion error-prone DNA polymerase V autoproteolytic subunit [Fundidesulfovibrio soli]